MEPREEILKFKVKLEIEVKKPVWVTPYSDEDQQREYWENRIKNDPYGEALDEKHEIESVEVE